MGETVRAATVEDTDAIKRVLEVPDRVVRRVLHERTIRLAETDDAVTAILAYDLWENTIHITHLGGDPEAVPSLLAEPQQIAARSNQDVEAIVPQQETAMVAAIEAAGFDHVGSGPRFHGAETHRYRLTPPVDDD